MAPSFLSRDLPLYRAEAERILAEEHIAYSEAIARVLSGAYEVEGRRYVRSR